MVASVTSSEIDRIRAVYSDRIRRLSGRYSLFAPGELYMNQRREEEILRLLAKHGKADLSGIRVLEIGCGRGAPLLDWCRWGAMPSSLHGVDLMEVFVQHARDLVPGAGLLVASGDRLPYRDRSFDVVVQLTVFTSILDARLRRAVAAEMCRVTARGGLILWYDFRYPNPRNPNVRAVRLPELRQLFPGWRADVRSLTLLAPIARSLGRVSFGLCRFLEWLPPLRSHYLAVFKREEHRDANAIDASVK
ncbi:MAG: class I SAM-dependent methyltransferase [Pseudolabrys sp.]|nr:class I SAM-dependent methyltransferase [Pseudolabrys sp.]